MPPRIHLHLIRSVTRVRFFFFDTLTLSPSPLPEIQIFWIAVLLASKSVVNIDWYDLKHQAILTAVTLIHSSEYTWSILFLFTWYISTFLKTTSYLCCMCACVVCVYHWRLVFFFLVFNSSDLCFIPNLKEKTCLFIK